MGDLLLTGARLALPTGMVAGHLAARDGRIERVGEGEPVAGPGDRPRVDLAGLLVAPGFIDLHVHGGGGAELWSGDAAQMRRACAFHARHGTTGLLATTLPAPPDRLREAVGAVAALAPEPDGAALLGVHLEGPFLSPERPGALDRRHMRLPDRGELADLLGAGEGAIRIMTLAPELPGALDVIADLVGAGVVPALGHSGAPYDITHAAIDAGARHATHLFNASARFHHREPGVAGAALDSQDVTCELIADGAHLHPATLRLVHRLKGPQAAILVTDAIPAAGAPGREHRLGDTPIVVEGGIARTFDGALAGSTLTMDAAVRRAHEAGIPLADALAMAGAAPARVLGLHGRKGVLAPGADADLTVLDDDLEVHATYRAGRPVYAREGVPGVVVTVTLNAGLDLTYEAPRFHWGEPNKVDRVLMRAGGKGINVARTLRQLGVDAVVTGLAGGRTGEAVRDELAQAGIAERLHPIAGDSRRTVVAVARDHGEATALNEPGPHVAAEEWRGFLEAFAAQLEGAFAVVLAGSLPVGVPTDAYAVLARAAHAHGVPVFLDATGEELLPAVSTCPALVKPNLAELDAARVPLGNGHHSGPVQRALAGAAALRRLGAGAAVVSLGEDGLVADAEGGRWHAVPPTVRGNPIGAGDAAVASLVAGYLTGDPWPERLRRAAAVSAAAVLAEQAGSIDAGAVPELLAGTLLEEIAAERHA